MLTQTLSDIGLVFSVNINGYDIPFHEWSATDDCIYYLPLATLVDNGYAKLYKNECTLPYENIYMLDEDEQKILGIPAAYNYTLRLRSDGMLNRSDFKYKLEYLSHAGDGKLLCCEVNKNIVIIDGTKYLLNEKQFALVTLVDDFNSLDESEKTPEFNLRRFAKIKQAAMDAGCELDSYLENENVYAPEKIKIDINRYEDGFDIEPALDIPESNKFANIYDKMRRIQGVYPVQRENGERVRVVLSPEQKDNLGQLKKTGNKHKTREEIKQFIDQPTEYFDPDAFDLSELYSDRVIEIGVYKPKFYPFICTYKSCWVAGATVETLENGTCKIVVEDEKSLEELKRAIKDAEKHKKESVSYKDAQISLRDAKFLAKTAEKQLRIPKTPIDVTDENGKKVLIIEENAEELGFVTKDKLIEHDGRYTLFSNPYLQPDFSLKVYQEEGVAWLQHLYRSKASGCLMADDMGLGKTLQLLYFIDWHSRTYSNHKPYLIVAPVSLLENWENEYARFFMEPRLKVCKLSSHNVPRKIDTEIIKRMQNMDVILTNYESLRISQLNFCAVEFDIVVLDEAQKIKSPGTMVTNAAKALKANFKVAMTGTPIENSLLDLWCIMDFCVPGLLDNAKAFAAKYQLPLKKEDTDLVALGNEIHKKLGIYFIRRLKADVANYFPNKIERKEQVVMPPVQEATYRNILHDYTSSIQPNMLVTIMNIRKVSEHPFLYDETLQTHNAKKLIETSARLVATERFLDEIKNKDEKVIVFAERKEVQKMLQRVCMEKYRIVPKIINGDTPTSVSRARGLKQSRQAAIDDFQATDGFNIIIMSPIAAGMGLNITAANNVIHYSRHWNPAKENQATDRAYRIGQTKDVYVYYPMAVMKEIQSFDIILDELLCRKTSLAASTIFPTERVEVTQTELGQKLFNN